VNRAPFAVVLVLAASLARAEESSKRTFSLESPAAVDCPAITTFAWRVLTRTSQAAEAPATSADVRFVVTVSVDAQGAVGTLEVVKGGKPSVRHMRAASCEEVIDALALVAAVILDPNASTKPIGSPPPATTKSPAAPTAPPTTAARATPTHTEPSTATAEPSLAVPPASGAPATSGEHGTAGRLRLLAGLRLLVTQGVAPDIVPGAGAFVGVRYDTEGSVWSPLVLAGVWFAESGTVESRLDDGRLLGTAEFGWRAFELIGCPLRTPVTGPIAVMPCVGIEAGQLSATGEAAKNGDTRSATWLATTAALKLLWTPIDVLEFDLAAGGFLSLSRDDFYFEAPLSTGTERVTVHEIPGLGAQASVGVSAMLP